MSDLHYRELRWVVEVHSRFWEPIAAFNAPSVALDYARDCANSHNGDLLYRVVEHREPEPSDIEWTVIGHALAGPRARR